MEPESTISQENSIKSRKISKSTMQTIGFTLIFFLLIMVYVNFSHLSYYYHVYLVKDCTVGNLNGELIGAGNCNYNIGPFAWSPDIKNVPVTHWATPP